MKRRSTSASSGCCLIAALLFSVALAPAAASQALKHQITLGPGQSWCDDTMITGLFDTVNAFRAQNGIPALKMDALGMKDAELRSTQFIAYMAAHQPGSPGFNPHQGYDTTAAGIGYSIVSENLAYMTSDPNYIVYSVWQDSLHLAAMLARDANITGVSCVYGADGVPYWTYEPGCSTDFCGQGGNGPSGSLPVIDTEEAAFLTLINNYRAQNGAGPLQISVALERSSQWMSGDMAAKNYAGHTDSLGRSPQARMAAFGYAWNPSGENIAGGYAAAQTNFDQWRTACDPDGSGNCTYAHRTNMLNPGYQVIGIGRAYNAGSSYGWYWTTDFGGYVDQTMSPGPATPPTVAPPVIGSFTASPATITSGQRSTLSWALAGGAATAVIDSGVGDVSNITSVGVSPSKTTTYTLTATNAGGSVTARTVVTVTTVADSQPPSTPTLVTAAAKSANEVDLKWTAATDNIAVKGYRILRNGAAISSVPATSLAWTDAGVTAGTSYTYTIQAYDAAGNSSGSSNAVRVTTPAMSSGVCPGPAINAFTGCYYSNTGMTGTPVIVTTDQQINFDWANGSPGNGIQPLNFSVRWQGIFGFNQGTCVFNVIASDGIRIYVDGSIILDRWRDESPFMYTVSQALTTGRHLITVEYYERTGGATAHLSWQGNAPAGQAPTISSFAATPSTISAGKSATLSWTVSDGTLSISNGIGNVSASGSRSISPAQTTTYVLTASNSFGTSTASTTITVTPAVNPGPDTTPPTAPGSFHAVARTATAVDLSWTASADNVGVVGYQITRNGTVLTTVSAASRSWSDTTVRASTAYAYSLRAYDAAGNYSVPSTATLTTPAAASGGCPAPVSGAFSGCYYNNISLSGNPVFVSTDAALDFSWGTGSPNAAVSAENFSARWQGYFRFDQGTYTFTAITSDGMRVYIDGNVVLDRWRDQPPYMYIVSHAMSSGVHLIAVEYYERTGGATATLSWQKQ